MVMNCIDTNAWYSRVDKPERVDYVVFDLDPPESRNGFAQAIRVAHLIGERSMTSGCARIRRRAALTASTRWCRSPAARRTRTPTSSRSVSRGLEAASPGLVTTEWLKKKAGACCRPPAERAREDDRLVTRTTEPGAPVSPAALGGTRREGAPARLRQARSAAAGGAARRPLEPALRGGQARPSVAPSAHGLELVRPQVDVGLGHGERLAGWQQAVLWLVPDDADRAADRVGARLEAVSG